MRVNSRVFTERTDMFSDIKIPNCPNVSIAGYSLKLACENIVNMLVKVGYAFPDYNKMTELDKILMLDYWREYDGLLDALFNEPKYFDSWFVSKATTPELIRRAREWLVSHNYLIVKPDVQQRAIEAGVKMGRAIKQ